MAEVPALNMRLNIDASGISAGVQKATAAMKQLSQSTDKDITKLRDKFDSLGRTVARQMKIATAAVAAFAVKLGKDAVQAAMEDEKSQAMLANALRNTTGATATAIAGVEDYITALQKTYSVTDDELRPALARLATATGSVANGQALMSTALDVSAFAGTDLASASDAVIKATKGQFKALQMLVPGISIATIKSKDLGKVFEEVGKITAGAAATRTQTFEYRVKGLRIAFGEILETLGYRLMPVLEKFVVMLQSRILPQVELWIALNKDKLADGLQKAAQAVLNLVVFAAKFGNWVINNTGTIKTLAVLMASLWATSKVYAFAKAIGAVTAALRGMATASAIAAGAGAAAGGAGVAAGAGGAAAAGVPGLIAAGIIAATYGLSKISPGEKARAKAKTAAQVLGNNLPKSPSPMDVMAGIKATSSSAPTATTDDLASWLKKITEELKKTNSKTSTSGNNIQYVTVYASDTNDIAVKLAKAAKNGVPVNATTSSSASSSKGSSRGGDSRGMKVL